MRMLQSADLAQVARVASARSDPRLPNLPPFPGRKNRGARQVLTPEVAGRWRVSVRLTSGGAGKAGENASKDEGRVAGRVSEEGASVMNPNDLSGRELMK